MLAGNDAEAAFPIIDTATYELWQLKKPKPSILDAMKIVYKAYREKRQEDAERLFLVPAGYLDYSTFLKSGPSQLSPTAFAELHTKVRDYELELELMVAGFDQRDTGQIFSCESIEQRGIPRRHDLGYYAIGSGAPNALYILQHREYGPKMPVRHALYCAVEAKFYGEDSPTVGYRTDTFVWSVDAHGSPQERPITEKTVDKELNRISRALEPKDLTERHFEILNSLEELKGVPACPLPEDLQKQKDKREARRHSDGKASQQKKRAASATSKQRKNRDIAIPSIERGKFFDALEKATKREK